MGIEVYILASREYVPPPPSELMSEPLCVWKGSSISTNPVEKPTTWTPSTALQRPLPSIRGCPVEPPPSPIRVEQIMIHENLRKVQMIITQKSDGRPTTVLVWSGHSLGKGADDCTYVLRIWDAWKGATNNPVITLTPFSREGARGAASSVAIPAISGETAHSNFLKLMAST